MLDARARAKSETCLVEGPHAVAEAIASDWHDVTDVFVTTNLATRERGLMRSADAAGVRITAVTTDVARSLSDAVTPQGIVAVVRAARRVTLADLVARHPRLAVVLDDVNDPGNAGTIIRTADAVGADAVVMAPTSVDPTNPKCLRAAAGSTFHLPIVIAPTAEAISALAADGATVLAADPRGDVDLDDLATVVGASPRVVWVFGNEARGLSAATLSSAQHRVRIDIAGRAESFNLAAAAAICMYVGSRITRDTT